MTTTIRISKHTRTLIAALAQADGTTMQETVEKAVDTYRRHRLLRETNGAYAAVRSDTEGQADLDREIGDWDETLADGLAGL